jgi:hypothetical protein
MRNRYSLQKATDGSRGERFIIVLEDDGHEADRSRPMSESEARLALHKLGSPDTAITSMLDQARGVSDEELRRGPR